MRTIEKKVYEFNELSKEAQKKALETYRYINVEGGWWDDMEDIFRDKLSTLGFINPEVSFSGFGSQGDGASFTCEGIDYVMARKQGVFKYDFRHKFIENLFFENITGYLSRRNYRYSHEYSVDYNWSVNDVTVFGDYPQLAKKLVSIGCEIGQQIDNFRCKLSVEFYRDLEAQYYAMMEDDAVKDAIEINSIEFYENGEVYYIG